MESPKFMKSNCLLLLYNHSDLETKVPLQKMFPQLKFIMLPRRL